VSAPTPFEDVARRILEGRAPKQVRSAAARGAVPLPRVALVRLWLALRDDEDSEIRAQAESSLTGLAKEAVLEVLRDEDCSPEVLDYFAGRATKDEAMAERIAFHRSVPDSALSTLAATGSADVIELVLTNQERLLSQPDLLSRLSLNPALRTVQRGKILELLDRATRHSAAAAAKDAPADAPADGETLPEDLQETARLLEVDIGELYAASEIMGGEEFEQSDDPEIRTAYQKIVMLNVAQKAILAMRGGREERMILVRDTNKLVALGVLRNPRINEDDVQKIARMRNVTDEVLRYVGKNREWTKSYAIILALVNNPRTPQGVTTNFVRRMQNQDLKRLVGNKDVPELIRRMAKRTLEIRTQKTTGHGKRH
jgi:hypothetical protein